MSKVRPILFSAPMILAFLAGRKTQTRRIVKGIPGAVSGHYYPSIGLAQFKCGDGRESQPMPCPYGVVGDTLYVKEAWAVRHQYDGHKPREIAAEKARVYYRASESGPSGLLWRSAMFMPRWASRITLTLTDVRVERLHDITEEDAKDEGACIQMRACGDGRHSYRNGYANLWDSINGKKAGCGFASDLYVWRLAFTVDTAEGGAA